MSVAVVTGAGGLIGSETARFLLDRGYDVVGIDNDLRAYFFGAEASTRWRLQQMSGSPHFSHFDIMCERLCGCKLNYSYVPEALIVDHRWWISDMSRFMDDDPSFLINWTVEDMLADILAAGSERWANKPAELAN